MHAQCCADGRGQRLGIGDGGQFHPAHAVAVGRLPACGEVQRHGGLAHAAGADDADQPVLVDQIVQSHEIVAAANEVRQRGRQVRLQLGGRPGRHHRRRGSRGRGMGKLPGRRTGALDLRRKPVAASGDGGDDVAAQHLAQAADLRGQVAFFHHHARPDLVDQLVLVQQLARLLDQGQQQVEGARADGGGLAVDEQTPLQRLQLEAAAGAEAL